MVNNLETTIKKSRLPEGNRGSSYKFNGLNLSGRSG